MADRMFGMFFNKDHLLRNRSYAQNGGNRIPSHEKVQYYRILHRVGGHENRRNGRLRPAQKRRRAPSPGPSASPTRRLSRSSPGIENARLNIFPMTAKIIASSANARANTMMYDSDWQNLPAQSVGHGLPPRRPFRRRPSRRSAGPASSDTPMLRSAAKLTS